RPNTAPAAPPAPNADRVRDYQDHLRTLEARMAREAQAAAVEAPAPRPEVHVEPEIHQREDPIAVDRRRREYESLFAGNVVLSRRPDAAALRGSAQSSPDRASPSIDDIADAVVRATMRAGTATGSELTAAQTQQRAASDAR